MTHIPCSPQRLPDPLHPETAVGIIKAALNAIMEYQADRGNTPINTKILSTSDNGSYTISPCECRRPDCFAVMLYIFETNHVDEPPLAIMQFIPGRIHDAAPVEVVDEGADVN